MTAPAIREDDNAGPRAEGPDVGTRFRRLERLLVSQLEPPAPPAVAMQLLQLGEAAAARLAELVRRDAVLSARVLRAANSAALARPTPAVSLHQAIAWLGHASLRSIALAVALRTTLFPQGALSSRLDALWRESLHTAGLAQEIARLRRRSVETAYLSGLLHRIGRVVLLARIAPMFGGTRGGSGRDAELPASQAEELAWLEPILTEREAAAGVQLAHAWQLPEAAVDVIAAWRAPDPHLGPHRIEVLQVAAARALLRRPEFATSTPKADSNGGALLDPAAAAEAEAAQAWLEELGIYVEDVAALAQRWPAICELLETLE